jgi:hypothetical protein
LGGFCALSYYLDIKLSGAIKKTKKQQQTCQKQEEEGTMVVELLDDAFHTCN